MATDTVVIYAGAAQHTYTRECDGFHEPGRCKNQAPFIIPMTAINPIGEPDA